MKPPSARAHENKTPRAREHPRPQGLGQETGPQSHGTLPPCGGHGKARDRGQAAGGPRPQPQQSAISGHRRRVPTATACLTPLTPCSGGGTPRVWAPGNSGAADHLPQALPCHGSPMDETEHSSPEGGQGPGRPARHGGCTPSARPRATTTLSGTAWRAGHLSPASRSFWATVSLPANREDRGRTPHGSPARKPRPFVCPRPRGGWQPKSVASGGSQGS